MEAALSRFGSGHAGIAVRVLLTFENGQSLLYEYWP